MRAEKKYDGICPFQGQTWAWAGFKTGRGLSRGREQTLSPIPHQDGHRTAPTLDLGLADLGMDRRGHGFSRHETPWT